MKLQPIKPSEIKIEEGVFTNLKQNQILSLEKIEDLRLVEVSGTGSATVWVLIFLIAISVAFPPFIIVALWVGWKLYQTRKNLSMEIYFERENGKRYGYSFKEDTFEEVVEAYKKLKKLAEGNYTEFIINGETDED